MTPDAHEADDRAFDHWYRETRPRLARSLLLFCAGDADVAADAADEAMVRAYERWSRVSAMASPEAWTFRVGSNVARRRYRRQAVERAALDRLRPTRRKSWRDPDAATRLTVWDAVAELDDRTRDVVALRYIVGLSEREVAEALGLPTGTVSSVLSRARQVLRGRLGES